MKLFIDSANLDQIKLARELGLLDGVTTNPTLLSKEGGDWRKRAEEICRVTDGPVSLEVIATDVDGMVKEARELIGLGPNVVVKVPMTTEGLKATRALSEQNVPTNVTLVFSAGQALLAAKCGATYVSPFVGRIDDIGGSGMELVAQILNIYGNYPFETEIIVASVRHTGHVLEAASLGADIATVPYSILLKLAEHPLTDKGIDAFLKDWEKVSKPR
jgi:transaldolase